MNVETPLGHSMQVTSPTPRPTSLPTAVYVHFPWCIKRCGYCDFATRATASAAIPHAAYADAVGAELAQRQVDLRQRQLVSVFFGGGTPSLWLPAAIARVLASILAAFDHHAADIEVTLECNPTSLDDATAASLQRAGINRLSIGVQSLQDDALHYLERQHDAAGALAAVQAASRLGVRVSADLMFGMPMQDEHQLFAAVDALLAAGARHLSLYALTLEHNTPFFRRHRRGQLPIAGEDAVATMFGAAQRHLPQRGLAHYEVSNYALPGETARHNQHTWRGGDYLGLGAAAVGCLTSSAGARRWRNHPEAERYMHLVLAGASPEESSESLDAEDRWRELLMLGLRTRDGIDIDEGCIRLGDEPWQRRQNAVRQELSRGNLHWLPANSPRLAVPPDRWLHLDGIVARLF